jgi:hypothetical protein
VRTQHAMFVAQKGVHVNILLRQPAPLSFKTCRPVSFHLCEA